MTSSRLALLALAALVCYPAVALDRPGTTFKIFQFPPNMIPRIDGNADDWAMVPDDYAIGGLAGSAYSPKIAVCNGK